MIMNHDHRYVCVSVSLSLFLSIKGNGVVCFLLCSFICPLKISFPSSLPEKSTTSCRGEQTESERERVSELVGFRGWCVII